MNLTFIGSAGRRLVDRLDKPPTGRQPAGSAAGHGMRQKQTARRSIVGLDSRQGRPDVLPHCTMPARARKIGTSMAASATRHALWLVTVLFKRPGSLLALHLKETVNDHEATDGFSVCECDDC